MLFTPFHKIAATAATLLALCLPVSSALAGEVIYASHFEDEIHELQGWKTGSPDEESAIAVRRLKPEEREGEAKGHSAALTIRTQERQEPLRIAQARDLFRLEPGAAYELRVTFRVPDLQLQPGGRVRIVVTDARWTWSSPPLTVTAPRGGWHTVSVPFSAPKGHSGDHFRIRLEALKVRLEMEIAEIAVVAAKP